MSKINLCFTIFIFIIFLLSLKFVFKDFNFSFNSYSFYYLKSFFPPKISEEFLIEIIRNAFLTIFIATTSVFVSTLISIPLSVCITYKYSKSLLFRRKMDLVPNILRKFSRLNLIFFRSMPELILALFFVKFFGLGIISGILSIVTTYIGLTTKVFIEIIESENTKIPEGFLSTGSKKFQTFFYSTLLSSYKDFISYIVFRWECAIRTSLVIGIVGAGGLGQQLFFAMQTMKLNEVTSIIICLFCIVLLSEYISKYLRRHLINK